MKNKSDAYVTLESSIIDGLSKRAHITGASIEHAYIQTEDIIKAMFHPSVCWAVESYLNENRKLKEKNELLEKEVEHLKKINAHQSKEIDKNVKIVSELCEKITERSGS
jgi:hypothetical protein